VAFKLLTFIRLRHDYHATQVQLVSLENEVSDLQQVANALEHDPEFVRKLASVDFGAQRQGEDRIPVEEDLQLSIRDNDPVFESPAESLPWYGSAIEPFALNQRVRRVTLFTSATIVVLAFMALGVPTSGRTSDSGRGVPKALGRYRKSDEH
jgi:hypothetical protein